MKRNKVDPYRAFYQTIEWRAISRDYLQGHPVCVLCGGRAQVSDHYPLSRRQLIDMGYCDPDADHRLRALCRHCHAVETAKHQPGGWNKQHGQGDE